MSDFDSSKDYYSILGARRDDPKSEIERRYKRLARQHHPDRGGSEEQMKSLNEAYGVLRDETTRQAYDSERRNTRPTHSARPVNRPAPPYSSPSAQADPVYGQCAGALLCMAVGLFLLLLVRFQWIWFLWPLGMLAAMVIIFGILMAHSAMRAFRGTFAPSHPAHKFKLAQELLFWSMVCGGVYGVYLVMSAV